jgi:anti-sigma factor RsiW
VLLLVALEELSYRDAAQVLGVPVGTVMSRLSRAREQMRALLSGEPPTHGTAALRVIGDMMDDEPRTPSHDADDTASAQLLSALLDGELSGPERREVLERLRSDPQSADRFAHYGAQRDALHALFCRPPRRRCSCSARVAPARGRVRIRRARGRAAAQRRAACRLDGVRRSSRVRRARGRRIRGVRARPRPSGRSRRARCRRCARLTGWLSARLGRPVRAPALDEYGYALLGGLLPGDAGPAAQLMYQRADGARAFTDRVRRAASRAARAVVARSPYVFLVGSRHRLCAVRRWRRTPACASSRSMRAAHSAARPTRGRADRPPAACVEQMNPKIRSC